MTEQELVERIVSRVLGELSKPRIPIEASGRHVHLKRADIDVLFGRGSELTRRGNLSQPGQFSCEERVRVVGPKGEFPSVIVLGPERPETQVELSLTDARFLGVDAPVRLSGDIASTPGVRIVGPQGEIETKNGVIAAKRHIHMTPEDAAAYGVHDGQTVSVTVYGERGTTFYGVALRVSPKFATYMHIDYDEANACAFREGMLGFLEMG
jgi:propanediol utilization protein